MEIIQGKYTTELILGNLSLDSYREFLEIKRLPSYDFKSGRFIVNTEFLSLLGEKENKEQLKFESFPDQMFDYQKFITKVALLKRKYAVFADCGLGKTYIFLEWMERVKKLISQDQKILIVSPFMVLEQTRQEQEKFYLKSDIVDVHEMGIYEWLDSDDRIGIVNYDVFRNEVDFGGRIGAIVCDESSIFKSEHGVIKTNIVKASKGLHYKLACTATPAPNDREEYANHALFLDKIRNYQEFFHRYFINRDSHWILKPHATDSFYKYLASFSVFLRSPKRYGFEDNLKDIPNPVISEIPISLTNEQLDFIRGMDERRGFGLAPKVELKGFVQRSKFSQISKGFVYGKERKDTRRIESNKPRKILDLMRGHPDEQILIWTNFDEEGNILEEVLKDGLDRSIFHLTGKVKESLRLEVIRDFKGGEIDILISKSRLLGFGLNFQNCSVMVFSGLNDSYEQYYQALRRVYRYGNTKQLKVYIPVTEFERVMLTNVMRKKDIFDVDATYQEGLYMKELAQELKDYADKEVFMESSSSERQDTIETEDYTLINGDNIVELEGMREDSIDFCIFSPPFASLFTYSSDIADMGNSGGDEEFTLNYRFFATRLLRAMKPGRKVCVHVSQLPELKSITGYSGIKDFRGLVYEAMSEVGFEKFGEIAIKKNQQMASVVKHAAGLAMHQFESDTAKCKPAFNDYILIFSKPGENEVPIIPSKNGEMTRDDWIKYASGCWMISEEKCDIRESDTLNTKVAKSEEDEKHICPLQLEVYRRLIRLYSNPGEVVLEPFAGIGSGGYVCMELGRRNISIELKSEYFSEMVKNVKRAKRRRIGTLGLVR